MRRRAAGNPHLTACSCACARVTSWLLRSWTASVGPWLMWCAVCGTSPPPARGCAAWPSRSTRFHPMTWQQGGRGKPGDTQRPKARPSGPDPRFRGSSCPAAGGRAGGRRRSRPSSGRRWPTRCCPAGSPLPTQHGVTASARPRSAACWPPAEQVLRLAFRAGETGHRLCGPDRRRASVQRRGGVRQGRGGRRGCLTCRYRAA